MKVVIALLAVSSACIAFAVPVPENEPAREYPRFWKAEREGGSIEVVDLEAKPNMEVLNEVTRNPANNMYLLYTRRNQYAAQTLVINDANSIRNSNFNPSQPTVVIVHGWLSKATSEMNPLIKNAYLRRSDTNVIIMDWRRLAMMDYVTAANGVPAIGRGLGQFLIFLNSVTGAAFNNMHLVGFSLGAHVVGNAGREIGGRAARVTGLDPAGPLWNYNRNRLSAADGRYVEAIHTDGSYLGYGIGTAIVDADFFPNGGRSQPGCVTNICDHNRAWELFAATVTHDHLIGSLCTSTSQISNNNCRGITLRMGNDDLRKTGSGMYRLNTDRRYPF